MAWISVHESIDGPKLRNLYKQLGCSKFEATGILNFLWFWGLTNAERDGLILYAEKEDIERYLYGVGAGCVLDPKKIVDALFDSSTGRLTESASTTGRLGKPNGKRPRMPESATLPASARVGGTAKRRPKTRKKRMRRRTVTRTVPRTARKSSLKSTGERLPQPKKRRPSLLNRRSPLRNRQHQSTRRPSTSSGTHTRKRLRKATPSRSIRPASMRASPRRSC